MSEKDSFLGYLKQFGRNLTGEQPEEEFDISDLDELIKDLSGIGISMTPEEIEGEVWAYWDGKEKNKENDFDFLKKNHKVFGTEKGWSDIFRVAFSPREIRGVMFFSFGLNQARLSSVLPRSPGRFLLRQKASRYMNYGYRKSKVLQKYISKGKFKEIKDSYKK
jgi:hypothetical protein